jgi:hypothetical protein
MNEARQRYGLIGLRILEIYPGSSPKTSRIINSLKLLVATGKLLMLHPRVKSAVIHQIVHYNPLKAKNIDDILDLLSYGHPAIQQYGIQLLKPFEIQNQSTASFSDTLEIAF